MLEFKRVISPEGTTWQLDGHPITISMGGPTHNVMAENLRLEHVICEPETPAADRNVYVIKSKNGKDIDDIDLQQSWVRETSGFRRHESHSMVMEYVMLLPEDASVLTCLAIETGMVNNRPNRIPLTEYLEQKK